MTKRKMNVLYVGVALCGLLSVMDSSAQKPCTDDVVQNSLWSLPTQFAWFPGDLDDPVTGSLPIPPDAVPGDDYTGQTATNAHNAMHDQNGELMFFIVDDGLYDKNGYGMAKLNLTSGAIPGVKGYSEICMVPDPANCEQYYIFSSTHGNEARTPVYTVLDISLPNANDPENDDKSGALIYGDFAYDNTKNIYSEVPLLNTDSNQAYAGPHDAYFFAASPLIESNNSRLVFMASSAGPIHRMRIDENGIEEIWPPLSFYDNILPDINLLAPGGASRFELELKQIDSTTFRLATVTKGEHATSSVSYSQIVLSVDLDLDGNYIPNSAQGYPMTGTGSNIPYVKGLEYSENGRYLYFTHQTNSNFPDAVQYIDLDSMQTSVLQIPNANNYEKSQIEVGPDSLLYFAHAGGLASLQSSNYPLSPWNANAVSISGGYAESQMGFPNQDYRFAYTLPDQIDGMNYYDHFFTTKECCLSYPTYDQEEFVADTSATWTGDDNPLRPEPCDTIQIRDQLIIPQGIHITIKNMRFEFFEDARVVIEPGGRLTLDSTIFTSGPCGCEMWLGVEVHGNPEASQLPVSNQGYLNMINNSVIEHAYIGALAASRYYWTGQVSSVSTGGIIRAFDSRFRNNKTDVWIHDYDWPGLPNHCHFINCDFLTDGLLNDPEVLPSSHAYLRRINDVQFRNCSFRNTASFADLPIDNRGTGVFSYNAIFRVIGDNETYEAAHDTLPISDNVHQSFYRLASGVVVNGQENHHFTVSKMEFQLNERGIDVFGVSKETITFNNFEIPTANSQYTNGGLGAYLSNTYLFTVEENNFFSDENLFNTGLIVDNSNKDASFTHHGADNEVYRNEFTNLSIGISVVNNNRGAQRNTGLVARCNQFSQANQADIYLTAGTEWRDDQGSGIEVEWLTNNVFSYAQYGPLVNYRDVRVHEDYGEQYSGSGLTFQYWCLQDDPTTKPLFDITNPNPIGQEHMEVTHNINHDNVLLDYENHCPSNFTSSGGGKFPLAESLQNQVAAENNLESAITVYETTIDGGETEDVLDLMVNIHDEESAYLRDLLLARHPLSDKALMAAIEAAESFDPWHLTQVMVANSKLPGEVYRFLETNEVLSPFFMQFIDDAQQNGGANLGRLLFAEVSHRSSEKTRAEREIHRHFLYHTDSVDYNEWNAYLQSRNEPHYILHRIGDHLDKGETGSAQALLDSLPIHEDRIDWVQFMIDIAVADTVTASDHSTGWDFFYNKPLTLGDAWGWLYAQGETDSLPPQPQIVENKSFSFAKHDDEEAVADRWLEAYPNPAKDRVVLTYPHEADGIGTVQLFNADGRLMKTFAASDSGFEEINITGWPTGVYIAKLFVNDKPIDTVKITVVK